VNVGTQEFSKNLARVLKPGSLILNSPVWSINQTPKGVYVTSGRGQFQCRRVIVSVPTTLYKDIVFNPPLPEDKLALSKVSKHGFVTKMNLIYKEPWWRDSKLSGMAQSWIGPVSVTRDVSVDMKGLYVLTCFVAADAGHTWSKLSAEDRKVQVVKQIRRMFSPYVERVPDPIDVVFHIWFEDQWSQGCPCPAMPAGVLSKLGHALRIPHQNIHFVGTETAYEWKGYMDGAIRSGERGAAEVIQELDTTLKAVL